MLILPADKDINWQHIPTVTILLIISNLLIFSLWQSQDTQKLEEITNYYKSSDLPKMEYPIFISYLYQSAQSELADKIETQWQGGDRNAIYPYIVSDLGFIQTLNQTDLSFWGGEEYDLWLEQHKVLESKARTLSHLKYGLTANENRPITYFTHHFLHKDWGHLAANLLFLAIAGVGVEAAIGSFHFLIAYIICGVFSGLAFTFFNGDSTTPLIGTFGPISAVLGMYAAIYKQRQIRFFYTVIVRSGYFEAPALIILSVWIAVTGLQLALNPGQHLSYSTSIAGMAAGASFILAFQRWIIRSDQQTEKAIQATMADNSHYRRQFHDAFNQLSTFNFEIAQKKFLEIEQEFPDDIPIKIQRYHLEKLFQNQNNVTRLATEIFQLGLQQPQHLQSIHDVFCDYVSLDYISPTPYSLNIKLLLAFTSIKQLDSAKKLSSLIAADPNKDFMLVKALNSLADALAENNQSAEADRYQTMANELREKFG